MREETTSTSGHPLVRAILKVIFKGLFKVLTRTEVRGLENVPEQGPLILVGNHLGFVDPILGGIYMPWPIEPIAKADLFQVPGTSLLLRLYGVIPVNHDRHDGTAMACALEALERGRVVGLLPEGRISVTGALERGRTGVAYLALTTGVPILPVAVTGTERALSELARLRRPPLTMTIGKAIQFPREVVTGPGRRDRLREVTDEIMRHIAALLPPAYRGVYEDAAAEGTDMPATYDDAAAGPLST